MQINAMHKSQIQYWRGRNDAVESMSNLLEELPSHIPLNDDQERLLEVFRFLCGELTPDEELLTVKPTNLQLSQKYAISPRTVTNWRKEDCPFEDGQWAVLDWMADRRYVPAKAKAKFASQLQRRVGAELDELELLVAEAKRLKRLTKLL